MEIINRWGLPLYHLYTHNDLDGVGCGIVARLAFGEKVEIRMNRLLILFGFFATVNV